MDILRLPGVRGMQIPRSRISQCHKQPQKRSRFYNSQQICLPTARQVLHESPSVTYPSPHTLNYMHPHLMSHSLPIKIVA